MEVYIKGMKMPSVCDECWALDESGDYPICRITEETRGYNFRVREKRMDRCPLMEPPNQIDALHNELPTVELKKGRWITMSDADGVYWACSECGEDIPRVVTQYDPRFDAYPRLESINPTNYCPHCGVKMERQK